MREFSDQKLQQGKAPALWVGFVASIFLVLAIVLRLVFGVWSQPVEQSVLGRPSCHRTIVRDVPATLFDVSPSIPNNKALSSLRQGLELVQNLYCVALRR